jgi:two-component system copper resistance phosphate regulon response regulator CusR
VRVLVVEDEPYAAAVIARGLREQSFAVDVAPDGATALEYVTVNDYDVVVLDVMLPKMDGFEVCRRLREDGIAVPILMLTARGEPNERVAGLDAGADDYLAKPYHFPELLARIRALLRRGPALASAVISIADLEVDTRARRVTRGGRTVVLTAKEYALLDYLVRRRGEVVTRSEIAEHVWDDSFDPLSNLIEVYIQRLRRKVDDGASPRLIHTRRGEGYVLAEDPGAASED